VKQETGYERHYLKLIYNGQLCGIALFNVDPTAQNEQRAFIRHVSTTKFEHMK
jgi:hypothetical protein